MQGKSGVYSDFSCTFFTTVQIVPTNILSILQLQLNPWILIWILRIFKLINTKNKSRMAGTSAHEAVPVIIPLFELESTTASADLHRAVEQVRLRVII